jgi:hypothetical protein
MKKTFSIVLALVLALGLSLATATSVAANVHDVSVDVTPDIVGLEAEYEIVFNITSTLAIGATISIEFPSGTTVPTSYATGNVTVEGVDISQGDIGVSGQVVTITLPMGIGAPAEVNVVFTEDAGITNPATPSADYTVRVKTSKEPTWVTSDEYTIRLADKSTYEFVFDVPETIWVDDPADVDVTLQTDVLGLDGYDHVQILFNVTEQPVASAVTFEVYDAPDWVSAGVDSGEWPIAGNFSVSADYQETFPFRLTFNKVGVYTIEFVLDDLTNGDIVEDEITVSVTGVSVDVELDKGWNLISLPIIPDNPAIAAMLMDIMDDVISVHHYRASTQSWLIYAPPDFTSLTTMEDGKAYWINMNAATNLTVVGQAVAPPGYQGLPPSYSVVEGWNMIGFRAMDSMEADTYLMGTDYVRIYGFDLDLNGWFSLAASQNMTPGLGYWVAFSEPGTIYP